MSDNPQAFPHGNPTHGGDIGMTLRDYFAGQTIASASALPMGPNDCLHRAKMAYQMADAMLAERKSHEADRAKEAL